jgi:hypothetical protein
MSIAAMRFDWLEKPQIGGNGEIADSTSRSFEFALTG